MDLQGPFDSSIKGHRYTLVIVDDHSRKGWKEFIKHKNDAAEKIKALITRLETATGLKVKKVCSDRGGEFVDGIIQSFFKEKGIEHEVSAPHTPQQNGVAECFNRTTHEHALAMLHDAKLSTGFWPEAHEYASYVRNCSPTRALSQTTLNEAFHGHKPNVASLCIFGSRCHVRIPPESRQKLDPHSLDGIFCGFEKGSKAYKIWIPARHKFIASHDVLVYEKVFSLTDLDDNIIVPVIQALSEGVQNPNQKSPSTQSPSSEQASKVPNPSADHPVSTSPPEPHLRRTEHITRPSWYKKATDLQKASDDHNKAINRAIKESREQQRIARERTGVEHASEPVRDLEPVPTDLKAKSRKLHTLPCMDR